MDLRRFPGDRSNAVIAAWLILYAATAATLASKLGLIAGGKSLGLVGCAVGCGILLRYRWARWLTLGACFLAIAAAFAAPILLFLVFGAPTSEALGFWRNVSSVAAIAFGIAGWYVLAYLRSERGRRNFAGVDDETVVLAREPSWVVLPSAATFVLLLMGVHDVGRRISNSFGRDAPPAPAVVESTRTRANDPVALEPFAANEPVENPDAAPIPEAAAPEQAPIHNGTMDIALTDICIDGFNARVKYTNLGTVPIRNAQFGLQVYVDRAMIHHTGDFKLDVPPTGVSLWTPEFDVTRSGYREGDDFHLVAQTYSRNVGQQNWDNDRLVRNLVIGSDRNPCPEVSTGS